MSKKTLNPEEIVTENVVGRRAAVGLIGGLAIGAGALTLGVAGSAEAQCTDRDPTDPAGHGRGRGISDSDPNDPAGRGRHC